MPGVCVCMQIEHISIADGEVDFSDYLLNLTSIYIDRTGCTCEFMILLLAVSEFKLIACCCLSANPGSGITMATTATMTSEESEEGVFYL